MPAVRADPILIILSFNGNCAAAKSWPGQSGDPHSAAVPMAGRTTKRDLFLRAIFSHFARIAVLFVRSRANFDPDENRFDCVAS